MNLWDGLLVIYKPMPSVHLFEIDVVEAEREMLWPEQCATSCAVPSFVECLHGDNHDRTSGHDISQSGERFIGFDIEHGYNIRTCRDHMFVEPNRVMFI